MFTEGKNIRGVLLIERARRHVWKIVCPVCGNVCEKDTSTLSRYFKGATAAFKCTCAGVRARHGLSGSPTMLSWESMIQRCYNPNANKYDNYGGRGIKVCDRWRVFINFFEDMGVRPEGTSLDRIDSNGDYCVDNCRWATVDEQVFNTRRIIKVSLNGSLMSLKHACAELGISYDVQRKKLKKGLPIDSRLSITQSVYMEC